MQDNNFNPQPEMGPTAPITSDMSPNPGATPQTEAPKKKFPIVPVVIASVIAIIAAFGITVGILVLVNKEEVKIPETSSTEKTKEEKEEPVEEEQTPVEEEDDEEKKEETPSGDSGGGSISALQRSQRNTQRMDDLSRLITAINAFQSNNNGKLPFSDGSVYIYFVSRYVDKSCSTKDGLTYTGCGTDFKDPSGKIYGFAKPITVSKKIKNAVADVKTMDYKFYPYTNAACGDENEVVLGAGARDVAVLMKIEGGAVVCNDNH